MKRAALWLGLLSPLLLTGCAGFAVFVDDTHSATPLVNHPLGNSENMRDIDGRSVDLAPLTSEPGNIWPGPVPPTLTLEDLAKQPMQPVPPLEQGTPIPQNSTLPALVMPAVPPHLQPRPNQDMLNGPLSNAPIPPSAPESGTGPSNKTLGIVVPNGNGTSTVIAPDGTITTIPTPP